MPFEREVFSGTIADALERSANDISEIQSHLTKLEQSLLAFKNAGDGEEAHKAFDSVIENGSAVSGTTQALTDNIQTVLLHYLVAALGESNVNLDGSN